MQLTVTGKQVDVGESLRAHVADNLDRILGKYFGSAIEAHVVFAKEAHLIRAEIAVRIGRGIVVNACAAANEFYAGFDTAADRVAKQLRRYKRRLRDHHARTRDTAAASEESEQVRSYILASPDEPELPEAGESEPGGPAIIAEMSAELPRLTVGEAVMRMDLADAPVLLFRNRSNGELNLVYRRSDGNIGWIDPALDPAGRRSLVEF
ncbi:MAG: ribosome-associated translation inhibitor RaiA [Alphaproteobacteria bacterium]|nr:ribosome-associated translation inhibitor RaiA [Alphaproteobacteria bacterium]